MTRYVANIIYMNEDPGNWVRKRFKGNKVWVEIDSDGKPVKKDGKCRIKYQLNQDYDYWVLPQGIKPLDSTQPASKNKKRAHNAAKEAPCKAEHLKEAICIFTDGASSGNPGHSGIGILFRYKGHVKEISKYIGIATNNIAELEAIRRGIQEVKNKNLPVRVFTDSKYAYGLLSLGWKARINQDIVTSIKGILSTFKDIKICKIRGHAGEEGNVRADFLATSAIKNRHEA